MLYSYFNLKVGLKHGSYLPQEFSKITDSMTMTGFLTVNFIYAIRYYDKGPLSKHWTIFYQSF